MSIPELHVELIRNIHLEISTKFRVKHLLIRSSRLTLLFSHLNNAWHRTKNNQNFSSWEELLQRLLQEWHWSSSFQYFLNYLFYLSLLRCVTLQMTYFFACDKDLNSYEWFQNNNLKLNQNTCHLLVSGYKHET